MQEDGQRTQNLVLGKFAHGRVQVIGPANLQHYLLFNIVSNSKE